MRLMATTFAVAAALGVFAVSATEAAPRKKAVAQRSAPSGSTVFTSRDEDGRVRTRIIVQKRSYLDGGTEVAPGTYHPANAMFFPTHRAADGLGNNIITNPPGPIPDAWYLRGKDNPWSRFGN